MQLEVQIAAALRRLVLEAPKGRELALGLEHPLYHRHAECADELVLEIGIAGMEGLRRRANAASAA